MRVAIRFAALGAAFSAFAGPSAADPCEAVRDRGPAPAHLAPGRIFSGSVVYVGDGDSLCVAQGPARTDWVEVRLADFSSPELKDPGGREGKAHLVAVALGRRVDCTARGKTWDRIAAVCRIGGEPIGALLRRRGAPEGGN